MSFLRFSLDGSPLDDEGFGLGESQDFVLDQSELDTATYGLAPNAYAFTSEGTASAPLGTLQAAITSLPIVLETASAPLGGTYTTANAIVSVIASGGSQLGGLTGQATTNGTVSVSAQANLGELTAHIQATPLMPAITFGNQFAVVHPNIIQPVIEPEPIVVQPPIVLAFADARLGKGYVSAISQIDFSILEDDAEILLLT